MVQKIVLGFYKQKSQSIFQFDSVLNYKLANVIASYSENKPVLIVSCWRTAKFYLIKQFCTTRRGTVQVARDLTKNNQFKTGTMFDEMRSSFAAKIKDSQLRDVLKNGVGYHHAGLDADDRRVVEQAFISGCLPILASTSTLSMGMNLPAHLVIIKNTEQLINGQLVGYSSTQISQMIGRAGRPQFDSKGIAVVMTSSDLKTSQTVRIFMCKVLTGFVTETNCSDLCMTEIKNLQSLGLVEFNGTESSVMTTGKLMMRNNMEFTTMRMIWELNGTETLEDLVHFIGCCSEMSDISLRNNEKVQLNNLNRARGRH
ncbi:probable ATP-dependent DNA helicase HFM1, partial [Clonorchis sinensis]